MPDPAAETIQQQATTSTHETAPAGTTNEIQALINKIDAQQQPAAIVPLGPALVDTPQTLAAQEALVSQVQQAPPPIAKDRQHAHMVHEALESGEATAQTILDAYPRMNETK